MFQDTLLIILHYTVPTPARDEQAEQAVFLYDCIQRPSA